MHQDLNANASSYISRLKRVPHESGSGTAALSRDKVCQQKGGGGGVRLGIKGILVPGTQRKGGELPAELSESQLVTDLPPAHKPAPPPPKKKNSDMKGHLKSDDIQVVHLDKDEEMQKLPLQPPYYDMAPSESTPFTDKLNSGHKDCDVQYAELDTAALASSPSPRSSAHTGPGDLVEYATIQPSSH
ncbi:hypothetical protein NQZ68_013066 [Dissostichus eleginoides]|nr:hypothetical protein NQZ68_013066 [Dissostichus eleginoides]